MNADALIVRQSFSDHGTFGMLRAGRFAAYTGELPWRGNRPNLSCIPPAIWQPPTFYDVIWTWSPAFRRETYRLVAVPARAGILEHSANLMGDKLAGLIAQLAGCIALGERLGWLGAQRALLISLPAVRRFESYMGRKPFRLEVAWAS